MGNSYSYTKPNSKTTDELWRTAIRKQLTQNNQLYLSFEIYKDITYKSGITEITKSKLLSILKSILDELNLSYTVSISRTNYKRHYFIDVNIIHTNKSERRLSRTKTSRAEQSFYYPTTPVPVQSFYYPAPTPIQQQVPTQTPAINH